MLRLRAGGDAELECWGARRKRGLFERVFDRELELTLAGPVTIGAQAAAE
jgi:hypothetical protein